MDRPLLGKFVGILREDVLNVKLFIGLIAALFPTLASANPTTLNYLEGAGIEFSVEGRGFSGDILVFPSGERVGVLPSDCEVLFQKERRKSPSEELYTSAVQELAEAEKNLAAHKEGRTTAIRGEIGSFSTWLEKKSGLEGVVQEKRRFITIVERYLREEYDREQKEPETIIKRVRFGEHVPIIYGSRAANWVRYSSPIDGNVCVGRKPTGGYLFLWSFTIVGQVKEQLDTLVRVFETKQRAWCAFSAGSVFKKGVPASGTGEWIWREDRDLYFRNWNKRAISIVAEKFAREGPWGATFQKIVVNAPSATREVVKEELEKGSRKAAVYHLLIAAADGKSDDWLKTEAKSLLEKTGSSPVADYLYYTGGAQESRGGIAYEYYLKADYKPTTFGGLTVEQHVEIETKVAKWREKKDAEQYIEPYSCE